MAEKRPLCYYSGAVEELRAGDSVPTPAADVAAVIHAAANKATPVDADEFGISDSADSWALKNVTWANIKSGLKAYLDGLTNWVSNGMLRNSAALSVIGRNGNSTGAPADIVAAGVDGEVLQVKDFPLAGTKSLIFDKIRTVGIEDLNQYRVIGRIASGTGAPAAVSCNAVARGALFSDVSEKTGAFADDDNVGVIDSADSYNYKYCFWSTIKNNIKNYLASIAGWVTYSCLQNMAAQSVLARAAGTAGTPADVALAEQTLLGRITGGNVAALTAAQVLTMLGVRDLSVVVKASDESWKSSTVLADVATMSFSVSANKTYLYLFLLDCNSHATPDWKLSIVSPASPGKLSIMALDTGSNPAAGGTATPQTVETASSTARYPVLVLGHLVNGANAGTLKLQAAQRYSSTQTVTIYAGSVGLCWECN